MKANYDREKIFLELCLTHFMSLVSSYTPWKHPNMPSFLMFLMDIDGPVTWNGFKLLACIFIKKETLVQVFSCEFCEISKDTFLQNTSGRPAPKRNEVSLSLFHMLYSFLKLTVFQIWFLTSCTPFATLFSCCTLFKV